MTDKTDHNAPEAFSSEVEALVQALSRELGVKKSRWYYDDEGDTLYIELENLDLFSDQEIEKKAGPYLDEADLDFEEVMLLPYSDD